MIWPFRARQSGSESSRPTLPQGQIVWAIGDIHGRDDLLAPLLNHILEEAALTPLAKTSIISLGDYVDRGPASRAVIDRLLSHQNDAKAQIVCLRGNHEQMLLDFYDGVEGSAAWLEFGGLATLANYGVSAPNPGASGIDALRRSFRLHFPAAHLEFFRGLPLFARRGDYVFVHAGMRAGVALEDQSPADLLWRRNGSEDDAKLGVTLVHGHTPTSDPTATALRINVDTGAYATGKLTAVRLNEQDQQFWIAKLSEGTIAIGRHILK